MQQSIYYIKFALQFADMQITELVCVCFCRGFSSEFFQNQLILIHKMNEIH